MSTSDIELDGYSCTLGSGKYGTVFKMEYQGSPVAIKIFGSTATSRTNFSEKARKDFLAECLMLKNLKHDNIVQYLKTAQTHINGQPFPTLIMTLMDMSLNRFFFTREAEDLRNFPHKEIKIANDVAQALHYLHEIAKPNIVHGDLHCGNVLLKYVTAYEGPLVKLCDFGLAKIVSTISSQHTEMSLLNSHSSSVTICIDDIGSTSRLRSASLGYYSQSDGGASEEGGGVVAAASTPKNIDTEIFQFGTIMWCIHAKSDRLSLGTTPEDNLKQINGRPLYDLVSACWSQDKPSAKFLLDKFKELKQQYPVIDPFAELNRTIASQQETIKSQQITIAYQTMKITELEKKLQEI